MNFYFYSPIIAKQKLEEFGSSINQMERKI